MISVCKLLLFTSLFWLWVFDASASPTYTLQGRILKPDSTVESDSSVQFKIQIRSPGAENCLLYEETQTLDMSSTNGLFSVLLNSGSGTRTDGNSFGFASIFSNGLPFSGLSCTSGSTYTPGSLDERNLILSFKDSTMSSFEVMPAATITHSAFAIEAYMVGGFQAGNLVRVADSSGVPQTAAALTAANFTELLALVNGTSTQYMSKSSKGALLPSFATDPTGLSAGDLWYDSVNKQIKFYDGTASQSLLIGSGTLSGDSITSGTIGGSTSMSTTGNVTAVNMSSSTDSVITLKVYESTSTRAATIKAPSAITNYNLVLPTGLPSTNACLISDTSGNLSWSANEPILQSGNSFGAAATIGTNDNYALNFETNNSTRMMIDSSGNVGIGTTTPGKNFEIDGFTGSLGIYSTSTGRSALAFFGPASGNDYGQVGYDGATVNLSSRTFGPDLTLGANGAERMRISATNGNVGIGTTTPSAVLQLKAGTAAASTAPLKFTAGTKLSTPEPGAVEYDGTNFYFTDSTNTRRTLATTTTTTYNNVSSISNSSGDITLAPASSTGAVLINSGTTSTGTSSGALVVTGGMAASGDIYSGASINAGTTLSAGTSLFAPQIYGSSSASGNIKIDGTSSGTSGNVLIATAGGRVGIGTASPAYALDVNGNIGLPNLGYIYGHGTGSFIQFGSTSNNLMFGTNGAERIRIDGSGNVGIGTTTPGAALDISNGGMGLVVGADDGAFTRTDSTIKKTRIGTPHYLNAQPPAALMVGINSSTTNQLLLGGGTSTMNAATHLMFYTAANNSTTTGSERMRIDPSGNVGIGTTSPTSKLTLDGDVSLIASSGSAHVGYNISSQTFTVNSVPVAHYGMTLGDPWSAGGFETLLSGYNGLGFYTNGLERLRIDKANGNVGIGTTSPSAALQIKAGTATLAPLMLTAGTNLTTPASGAIEYDGTNLYFTDSTNTRRTLASTSGASAATFSQDVTMGGAGTGLAVTNNETVGGTLAVTGATSVTNSTASTSPSTGALKVSGGAGVAGDIYAGASINAATTLTAGTSLTVPQIYGSSAASGNVKIDGTSNATVGNVLLATAGGNVGIGTTNPTSRLYVDNSAGSGAALTVRGASGQDILQIIQNNGTAGARFSQWGDMYNWSRMYNNFIDLFQNVTVANNMNFGWSSTATPTAAEDTGLSRLSAAKVAVGNGTNGDYSGTLIAGNVGIGTTSPAGTLDVEGGTAAAATDGSNVKIVAQSAGAGNQNGGNIVLYPGSKSGTGYYGGVGIGAVPPNWIGANGLYVSGQIYSVMGYIANTTYNYGSSTVKTVANSNGTQSQDYWTVQTANTERIRVDANGSVGVGTTSPAEKLHVVGNIKASGQIYSGSQTITSGTTAIDFANGNSISTDYNCGSAFSLANLADGGTYTLVVTDAGTTQCSFSTTTTGTGAGTVSYKWRPANTTRTASTHTVYTLMRVGSVVYVSWATGFQ